MVHIYRVVDRRWESVRIGAGTYRAETAADALTQAARDSGLDSPKSTWTALQQVDDADLRAAVQSAPRYTEISGHDADHEEA